jgi:hypothetical protein
MTDGEKAEELSRKLREQGYELRIYPIADSTRAAFEGFTKSIGYSDYLYRYEVAIMWKSWCAAIEHVNTARAEMP